MLTERQNRLMAWAAGMVVLSAYTHCVMAHGAEMVQQVQQVQQHTADRPWQPGTPTCENESACICKGVTATTVDLDATGSLVGPAPMADLPSHELTDWDGLRLLMPPDRPFGHPVSFLDAHAARIQLGSLTL